MASLNSLPIEHWMEWIPFLFLLHNLEELPFMAAWSRTLPLKLHPIRTTKQFAVAVGFLTLSAFLVVRLGLDVLARPAGILLVLGLQMTLAFNVIVPHAAAAIRFRRYNPGLATGVLLLLPFSVHLFGRAFAGRLLTWGQFWLLFGLAPVVMLASTGLSLKVGSLLTE